MEIETETNSSTSFQDALKLIEKGVPLPTPQSAKAPGPELNEANEADSSLTENEGRITSSQRMKYAAEVKIIKQRWGDLESIRRKLGLSQRKMSQLLMVDPSAWTRWTREDGEAPPHIYRSLSWFLTLQEKHPENQPHAWLASVSHPRLPEREVLSIKNRLLNELNGALQGTIDGSLEFSITQRLKTWKYIMIAQSAVLVIVLALLCMRLVQS